MTKALPRDRFVRFRQTLPMASLLDVQVSSPTLPANNTPAITNSKQEDKQKQQHAGKNA